MIKKWLRNYFSIVLLLSSFVGSFHHHNDALPHNDCQICTIISNSVDTDTPVDTTSFSELSLLKEDIITEPKTFLLSTTYESYDSRAPPRLS